ncbi:hypothetical protein BHUM_03393 [Candidatus Burkholderia humilis]|nr:hypothetical protein BHUM_03393 [Candidatus Burkholderia humilis]
MVRLSPPWTPTRAASGYLEFKRKFARASVTTVAIYGDGACANPIEIAFNIEAIASAVNHDATQLRTWVEICRAATGRAVHEDPRDGYARVRIGSKYELTALIASWHDLTAPAQTAAPCLACAATGSFVAGPFYIEGDGSKTFFAPVLKRPRGYQVGKKGEERFIPDYWEALAYLKGMTSPAFRRPNENGNPGS